MSGLKLTGQWEQYLRALDPQRFEQRLRREVRRATQRNALLVQREIRARIRDGKYAENSPLTLAIKAPKSKPLVATGGLFQAITQELASDFVAFVGLKFGAKGKDGTDLVNVGLALHEGFTLQVTPAMRRAVFAKLRANGRQSQEEKPGRSGEPARAVWVIPSRPFIRDVIEDPAVQRQVQDNWAQAVAAAMLQL